ncbi:lanthionine synthetase C family protein [Nonomuraea sp. NPDC052116]|uniref:lanthionine synthetase C family protein n=1 Tax=Nonomuraea sp. NPDC052116 TaxID=3155665 RepID=UPI00343376C8
MALLHIERATSGIAGWQQAHDWLTLATREELTIGANAGLYHGAPALAFALHPARHPGYRPAHEALDEAVAAIVRDRLAAASQRLGRGERPALAEFDLISGLCGLGAHLWRRDPGGDLVKGVLAYLVRLTEPVDGLPGWWTMSSAKRTTQAPPGGHSNHGMAHGITGPLTLLALTASAGLVVPGQTEAIGRICAWLDDWQQDHFGAPWWPETITLAEHQQGRTTQPEPRRPSWCYGTPGIARAQQLAADATDNPARRGIAEKAMAECLTDQHLQKITEPGLCHGMAGVYQTAYRASLDAANPAIGQRLPALAAALTQHAATRQDDAEGLLTGAAGVGLALETARHNTPPRSGWDACLLIT